MKILFSKIKTSFKRNAGRIIFFTYAFGLGTSLPLIFSRCNSNCLSCGSCSLYLGIIPIIAAAALKNKIKQGWSHLIHLFSRVPDKERI